MKEKGMQLCGGLIVILILLIGVGFIQGATVTPPPEATSALLKQGKELYKKECSICHGPEGKGDGLAAYLLFPKPRVLTDGIFKIRSTPTGEPPTDRDLFQTITQGLPGSAMPSFISLSEKERWALVYYIKELGAITEKPERVIQVPPDAPPLTPQTLAAGEEVYKTLKCWECHGFKGQADGPSVPTSKDNWGFPAPPNDFTRGIYKGGGENKDIYLRFVTGMDGSPMPSFEDWAEEEERWALVHYVRSLAGPKMAVQPSTGTIVAEKISDRLPQHPQDALWDKITPTQIPLMLLWQRQKVVDYTSVKAVHNGKEIAFLLEWEDLEPAARFVRHQDYADGAAIQFALSQKPPLFTMGETEGSVNIWYWRADRQMDLDRFQDMEDVYQGMVADDYQSAEGWYPKDIEKAHHLPMASAPAHDPLFISGWGAGNPVSIPWRTSAVEDLNAEGFGTLTTQEEQDQNVIGQGYWVNGAWKVIFLRSLKRKGRFDVKLAPGTEVPVGFAVWDGSKGDRDGQKAVTTWYTLQVKK